VLVLRAQVLAFRCRVLETIQRVLLDVHEMLDLREMPLKVTCFPVCV
jgi:hypothetical protein